LLVVAENLFGGEVVGSGAELAYAGRHHDDVLLFRVDALERPLQMIQGVVIADRNHHVAGTDSQAGTVYGVALQQLKVLLHVLLGQRVLAPVDALGNSEDQEKCAGKAQPSHGRDRFGE